MKGLHVPLFAAALISGMYCLSQQPPGTECGPAGEPLFALTLDRAEIPLHATAVGSFAIFPVTRSSQVLVHAGFDVRWVDVRPLQSGIHAAIAPNHRDVSFALAEAKPLTIEFNDDLAHVVHLFPYVPGDGTTTVSGKGVRYFGPGIHQPGVIEMHSGETLVLAPGAWVKGAVRARNQSHVSIRGFGVLDGSDIFEGTASYGGRSPIYMEKVEGATIDGITVVNSHDWTVHLRQSDGARINGIKVLNPGSWNGDDGIDLVSSSHAVVENVFVRTNDDCVVVKNLADVDTSDITVRSSVFWNMPNGGNAIEIGFETRAHPIHAVRFQDIDMIHVQRGAAISIHNGDSAAVYDVVYEDIRIEDVRRKLIDFAVLYAPYGPDSPTDEGEIRGRMDRGGTWDAALCYMPSEKRQLFQNRGRIKAVHLKNIRVIAGSLPYSVLAGFDRDHGVDDIELTDIEYQGRRLSDASALKLVQDHVSGVSIR